jgi:hypothetical protein
MKNKIARIIILLLIIGFVADQASTRILISHEGIDNETNPLIRINWGKNGGIWILGDIFFIGLTLGVSGSLSKIKKRNRGLKLSQYVFLLFILMSAMVKLTVSYSNIQYLLKIIS